MFYYMEGLQISLKSKINYLRIDLRNFCVIYEYLLIFKKIMPKKRFKIARAFSLPKINPTY